MPKANYTSLITIGITCYNAQDTIAKAVKSALQQDWPNFEIVLVDDCSTDQSVNIVNSIMVQYDHIPITLIMHKKNMGVGSTRNTIINNAKGDFIAFFDDDDESMPNRLTKQYHNIIAYEKSLNTHLIACYASGYRLYSNGYTLKLTAIGSELLPPQGTQIVDYLLYYKQEKGVFYGRGTPTCCLMARKTTFNIVGKFDTNLRRLEDCDFAIRLGFKGGYFIGCKENLFTQYSTNAQDKSPMKNLQGESLLAQKNKKYLKRKKVYFYAKTWPKVRFYHFTNQHFKMVKLMIILWLLHPILLTNRMLTSILKRVSHEKNMRKEVKLR